MELLEYLKKVLGDEEGKKSYDKIVADKENVLLVDSKKEGRYVEKAKLDDANSTIKDYKKQLKDRDKQLEDLKEKTKDNEELSAEIEKLKFENEKATQEYESKIKEKDFNYSLERALTDSKAKNAMAVKALLNLDNIKLDGENLIGLKEQIDKLKESDSYLFETGVEGGTGTIGGDSSSFDNTDNSKTESLGERLAKEKVEQLSGNEKLDGFFK